MPILTKYVAQCDTCRRQSAPFRKLWVLPDEVARTWNIQLCFFPPGFVFTCAACLASGNLPGPPLALGT